MTEHESQLHRRAWDAIPWVVAGAASTDEVRCVEEHLPRCTECQGEWGLQQRVHAGLNASVPALDALPDTRAGWHRLAARLEVGDGPAPLPVRSVAGHGVARNGRSGHAPAGPARWTRWLVAAVVVQAVGLGAAGLALLDRSREPDADYRTLSQPSAAPAVPAAARLRVVPAPGMDFAELRELLAQTRMVAVDVGPDGNSLGLAAADGEPRTVAAALPRLRATPLLMLVEPVAAPR